MRALGLAVFAIAFASSAASAGAGETIDLASFTCKELMRGDDADRDAGISFYHGFFAGKRGKGSVDVDALAAQSDKVADYCLSNPKTTVMDAFKAATK